MTEELQPAKAPAAPTRPTSPNQLLGSWILEVHEVERRTSGEREPIYDRPARGVIVLGADGKLMTVIASTEDASASTGKGRAAQRKTYRADGRRWMTHNLVGEKLHMVSAWYSSPSHDYDVVRDHLVWSRDSLV